MWRTIADPAVPDDPNVNFDAMQQALADARISQPVLVIDRVSLDANLDHLAATVHDSLDVRIVAKSLPSPALLRHVVSRLEADRFMTFNLPMLLDVAQQFPAADQLCGKPFPVVAAGQFLESVDNVAAEKVQWLIDTTERLAQYDHLGTRVGARLRISLELDVGLHRGGFEPGWQLQLALERVADSEHLEFAGFMGYEAHVTRFPAGRLRQRMFNKALDVYRVAVGMAQDVLGADRCAAAVYNAAGSPTYSLHGAESVATEISIGSTLLKGTDFDTDLLTGFRPAVFIAAPVLKVLPSAKVPGFELLDRARSRVGMTRDRAIFIHGGHWLAEGCHPPELTNDAVFGRSSNQEMFRIPADAHLAPDEFVFLRPTQTEAVLLQFGDLVVHHDGRIVDRWPTFPPSA